MVGVQLVRVLRILVRRMNTSAACMEQQPVIPACASLEHRVVLALSEVYGVPIGKSQQFFAPGSTSCTTCYVAVGVCVL